ncbi:MAG: polysaccharide biosynthesis tyrosine autokinase [Phycisphaerales bacterium]|nr:MAG: polysaccharide biosynthesis tyrosine autokinase [Phycisphaerales bacterium]
MPEDRPVAANRMARPTSPQAQAIVSLTPKEVFAIIRRHIFLISFLTLLGLGAGGGIWKLLQMYFPRYTAKTYIQVLPPVEKDPMTISTVQLQKDILYEHRQSIASLIKQQRTLEDLLGRDAVRETEWSKQWDGDRRRAVRYLKKHFGAYAHRDSAFVEISMTCGAAKEAADIVNEMLTLFLAQQGTNEQREISNRLQRLEEQRIRVKGELDAANKGLDDIRTAYDLTDLERPAGRYFQHTITIKLNSLELQRNELDLAIRQFKADIANLEELATGPITEQIEFAIERDPVMTDLARQLALLEAQLSGMLSKFGDNHYEVRRIRDSIQKAKDERELRKKEIAEQTRRANLENAKDSLIVLQERFEQLEQLRQEAEAKKKQLDIARVQYDKGLKIRDERLEMLDSVKEQIEKMKTLHDDPETPKVLPVGLASIPLEMVFSRQWWLWFPSGILLGLLLGMGMAFLVELANDLVRTPSDVARFLRIALLGVIPDASEDRQVRGIELCHAVRKAPYSVISESYRQCRTNLKLSGPAESLKTLLVSSGMARDGKTSVAVNLATSFVAADQKVLLIDANFRQPNLHTLFAKAERINAGERFDFGLSSILTRQCAGKEAIRPSGVEGLDIIDCGPLPANPAELLGSVRMEELLREQRRSYDHVIIDGPPVLLVSDAKILAGLVDATLLVFNAAATSRGAAQRTIRQLKEVNAKVIGCVLFGARAIKGGYFQEQFKSYRRYQKKAQLAGSRH